MTEVEVDTCSGQNCYHNETVYPENELAQMRSLVERSLECSQEINIQCISAPVKVSFSCKVWVKKKKKDMTRPKIAHKLKVHNFGSILMKLCKTYYFMILVNLHFMICFRVALSQDYIP